mmetsp:Transcript_51979/g.161672  ORF Transcript_51979/g.161672 Transcript_51979/m.161672 type:complete len:92 (-) Transcript_51979:39-314(-)
MMPFSTTVLELLLERGCDMEVKDREGATALWTAVSYRMVKSVRTLVAAGASTRVTSSNGTSLLDHAMSQAAMPADIVDNIRGRGEELSSSL